VRGLSQQFPQLTPLALVLKQFLKARSLHAAYTGGLSSYCLVLLVVAFLQQRRNATRPPSQPTPATERAAPHASPPPPAHTPAHTPATMRPPEAEEAAAEEAALGPLLLDFLFFYGRVFDPRCSMVSSTFPRPASLDQLFKPCVSSALLGNYTTLVKGPMYTLWPGSGLTLFPLPCAS
jgi:DNA polymerase sigma